MDMVHHAASGVEKALTVVGIEKETISSKPYEHVAKERKT